MNQTKAPINKCPHCGSDEGYYTKKTTKRRYICLNIIENIPINDIIKSRLKELCCPKSENEEKDQFLCWLHRQSWVVQQDVYNRLTQILRIEPKGE